MSDLDATYSAFAAAHGLEQLQQLQAGPRTPLLFESKHCQIEPAARGTLPGGASGVVGHLAYQRNKKFRFSVAVAEVPVATGFAPRVFCVRRGRKTRDDEFYGFEARYSKLWTESIDLNERFAVSTSPFQDENWMRQLFSPVFIDWLATETPGDFSFELVTAPCSAASRRTTPTRQGSRLSASRPPTSPSGSAPSARRPPEMQMNRTGVGLISFFLLAGLGLIVVPIVLTGASQVSGILASIGAIWIIVALGLVLYGRRQKAKGEHQDSIFRTGIRGTATIRGISSHAEINEMPVMKLKLDLDIPGHGSRQVTTKETMPVFVATRMEEGLVLPAYANPQDPGDFILVW